MQSSSHIQHIQVLRKIDQFQLMKQRYTHDQIRTAIDEMLKKEGLHYTTSHTTSTTNNNNSSSSSSSSSSSNSNNNPSRIDEASHYILRISYCQTEELRRWFLTMECELLRHRLHSLYIHNNSSSNNNNNNNNSDWTKSLYIQHASALHNLRPISAQQKRELQIPLQQLLAATTSTHDPNRNNNNGNNNFQNTIFFSVPFLEAIDLLSKRDCYLHRGIAYMTQSKVMAIVLQTFRTQLSYTLSHMSHQFHTTSGTIGGGSSSNSTNDSSILSLQPKNTPTTTTTSNNTTSAAESTRLIPFLRNIHRCLTNPSDSAHDADGAMHSHNAITASTVLLYQANMPLCMRQLQKGLQHDKKLKHWGRLQYGLFLKGSGMTMEDALVFFQRHFTAVTNEQFQKEYAYNIRHMYGKEGKRATYTPYNCSKIILGNAPGSTSDHHGCPYKHYDVDHIETLLKEVHITNAADRHAIIKLKQSHQYQLACVKQFEVQHLKYNNIHNSSSSKTGPVVVDTSMLDNVGNHPNAWFRASIYYQHEVNSTATTATNVTSGSNSSSNTAIKTISP
jgi:DNA primase large subunit